MVVPSYTEDLTDVSLADEAAGWVEMTGTDQDGEAYNANGGPAYEDNEYPYIQGLYAVTQDTTKSTSVGSLAYSSGGITIPTDGALFLWHNYSSPFAMGTYAQGGYRILMGSGLLDFNVWYVGGSDKDNNPYGGWVNHVVNDTVTRDNWAGTSTSIDYVGSAISVISGPSKGEPHQCDAIRYGRGSAIFEYGETANYCTIAGFAALNDNQSNRWGLLQSTSGGYLWKGRWSLGTASNAVDFRDSNKTIFLQWTPKVTINFNTIEVLNASSNIEMDGFQFIVLDPTGTASRGSWITTANATVSLISCNFSDMYTFVFDSNTTLTNSTFKRCNQITQGGSTFDGCNIDSSDSAVSLVVDSLADITDCTFTSDGSNHAVNLGTIASTTSVSWNNFLSGYASTDGSTGNEAILVNVAAGETLTINVSSGYDTPSVYNTGTGSIVKVINPVTTAITVKDSAGDFVVGARVLIWVADSSNYFYQATPTSITGTGTTITVTQTAHGMVTGDNVIIEGVDNDDNYNGAYYVTVTGIDTYTYVSSETISVSPATGTIKTTFAIINDITDASGYISDTRSWDVEQSIVGRVRKAS